MSGLARNRRDAGTGMVSGPGSGVVAKVGTWRRRRGGPTEFDGGRDAAVILAGSGGKAVVRQDGRGT